MKRNFSSIRKYSLKKKKLKATKISASLGSLQSADWIWVGTDWTDLKKGNQVRRLTSILPLPFRAVWEGRVD